SLLGGQVRGAGDECADALVQGVGAGEGVLEDLCRGGLPTTDRPGQLPGGQIVQLSHTSSLSPRPRRCPGWWRRARWASDSWSGRWSGRWTGRTRRTGKTGRAVPATGHPAAVLAAGIPPDGPDD